MAESLAQKSALQLIQERFASYGISGLADAVRKLIADNTDAGGNISESLVMSGLRQTPEYQRRFAGNVERKRIIEQDVAAGRQPRFGLLSESEYVQAEQGYRQVLRDFTIPGFYDTPDSYTSLIANDISVKELGARAQAAQQAVSRANPEIKQQLKSLYGIEENQLTAYFLDPAKATTALTPVAVSNAAVLAAAAQRGGAQITKQEAESLAERIAPASTELISDQLFQQTSSVLGLTQEDVSGEKSTLSATQALGAAAGLAEDRQAAEKERQRRLASTQSASGMATTEKGVVGLQRANR